MGINDKIDEKIDETNQKIDDKIDETNQNIDHKIDEVNEDADDMVSELSSAVSMKHVADALLEEEPRKNPFNDIDHEKAEAIKQQQEERESSFQQAVREQNMRLQREADHKGMRQAERTKDKDLAR